MYSSMECWIGSEQSNLQAEVRMQCQMKQCTKPLYPVNDIDDTVLSIRRSFQYQQGPVQRNEPALDWYSLPEQWYQRQIVALYWVVEAVLPMLLLVHLDHRLIQQQWVDSLHVPPKTAQGQACWSHLRSVHTSQDLVWSDADWSPNEHSPSWLVHCPSAAQSDVADLNRCSVQTDSTAVQAWSYHCAATQTQTLITGPVQWPSVTPQWSRSSILDHLPEIHWQYRPLEK